MFKDGPMQSHMFWQSKADDLTHYLYSINGRARVIPGAAHICEKLVGRAAREDRQVFRHAELRDDLHGSCVPAAHRPPTRGRSSHLREARRVVAHSYISEGCFCFLGAVLLNIDREDMGHFTYSDTERRKVSYLQEVEHSWPTSSRRCVRPLITV